VVGVQGYAVIPSQDYGINAERVVMPSDERESARHGSFAAL